MKRCVQTDIVFQVMELLTGEEFRAIEAAKRLIADSTHVDPDLLSRVMLDAQYKPWSKIMSAYVLGFLPPSADSSHQVALRQVLANSALGTRLRDHAAEALGNLRDEEAATLLSERLEDEREATSVRKSCIFALSQLTSSVAVATLQRFAATNPRGALRRELTAAASIEN